MCCTYDLITSFRLFIGNNDDSDSACIALLTHVRTHETGNRIAIDWRDKRHTVDHDDAKDRREEPAERVGEFDTARVGNR